uniref:IS200/IS605 family transposase n=1 Tax=Singulisphaera acidiphila TaxID=466153 RepID=UPI0036F3D21C
MTASSRLSGWSTTERTTHTGLTSSSTWCGSPTYRKKLLRGDVGLRLCQIVRTICAESEADIFKGHVSSDHVHLFVSCPPHMSASYLMQRINGEEFTTAAAGV